jgi:hypothetical protein
MLHKIQVQTFKVSTHLLDRVTHHAVFYPSDEDLVLTRERKESWEQARGSILSMVHLYEKAKDVHLEPFRVSKCE